MEDELVGETARTLIDEAMTLLTQMDEDGVLQPRAVVGLFPAHSEGDDIHLFSPSDIATGRDRGTENQSTPIAVLRTLRQQFRKDGRANLALSDFVAPKGSQPDWVGGFAVTSGRLVDQLSARFEAEHDDYHAIMSKSLADRIAEALAEYVHEHVRQVLWGYAADETFDNDALIAEAYRGIRPAPGYPACPDHSEKRVLFDILRAEESIGVTLTETYAMAPGASVSGWYFAHPEARYFGVGRLGRDQVEDYARRKRWSLEDAERWLAPNLGYTPTNGT